MQAVVLVDAQKVLELTRDAATCPMGQDKPFPEDPEILSLGCVEQHEETGTILRKVFEELWNKVQANRWMSREFARIVLLSRAGGGGVILFL